jgi:hypothetical protein
MGLILDSIFLITKTSKKLVKEKLLENKIFKHAKYFT